MSGREKKLAFFAADGELTYEKVVNFMDLCRNNGAQKLGIVFDDLRIARRLSSPCSPSLAALSRPGRGWVGFRPGPPGWKRTRRLLQ